ncbi:hypothetical protein ACWEP8_36835 [Streptomyces hydrogenans]
MSNEWEAGSVPWLRRQQKDTTFGHEPAGVLCMFCGASTAKRSVGDREEDPGRLELYCDNTDCDAREMVLLVTRDGDGAGDRADARALRLIDRGTLDVHASYPAEVESYDMSELMSQRGQETERRMRKESLPTD